MRSCVIEYAIPRTKISEARARDLRNNSSSAIVALYEIAKRAFTDIKNSGEGGELLLFLLAERFLKLPQVLCKMDIKTSTRMHFHGSDGVYASVDRSGRLNLHWGESKIHKTAAQAIKACFSSLAPFLAEPDSEDAERERDLLLLADKANLDDPALLDAFKQYFDRSSPKSNKVRYSGLALVGFDANCYPSEDVDAVLDSVTKKIKKDLVGWNKVVGTRITAESLDKLDIHLFCVPLPSADKFRTEFIKVLGL
jgi:hypothetical protein